MKATIDYNITIKDVATQSVVSTHTLNAGEENCAGEFEQFFLTNNIDVINNFYEINEI